MMTWRRRFGALAFVVAFGLAAAVTAAPTLHDQPAIWAAPALAPVPPAAATVTVAPASGLATDTFVFTLVGFAPGERVVVSFRPADEDIVELVRELIGLPEDVTVWVADGGVGRLELRPAVQWGPTAPGTWAIRFTGDVSGPIQQAVTIDIECRC